MTEANSVLVDREGPVTIIAINRPHCRNAVDGATARKLYDAFLAFDADKDASVAVFRHRRLLLRRCGLEGGGSGRSQQEARDRRFRHHRADGAEPAAAVKTRDRRGRGI